MPDLNLQNEFKTKLSSAGSVLLLLPPEPDLDSSSAAVSLYHALSGDKQVMLGCSTSISEKYPDLMGAEDCKNHIGNQTLVVSFDYREDAVENVSYDIDDSTKKFNLRIQPRPNQAPLDTNKVSYSYTGAQADLVITFGINSLEELGGLYSEEKTFLDSATITNFITSPRPSTFASINLNFTSPLTETMALIIKDLGLKLSPQSATNLFQQLSKTTNNFQSPAVSADTFELAAFLLRSGAQKNSRIPFLNPNTPPFTTPFGPMIPPEEAEKPNIPSDWSGPKIYRGGNPMK